MTDFIKMRPFSYVGTNQQAFIADKCGNRVILVRGWGRFTSHHLNPAKSQDENESQNEEITDLFGLNYIQNQGVMIFPQDREEYVLRSSGKIVDIQSN